MTKPEVGHLEKAGVDMKKYLKEFRLSDVDCATVGDVVKADVFAPATRLMSPEYQKVRATPA